MKNSILCLLTLLMCNTSCSDKSHSSNDNESLSKEESILGLQKPGINPRLFAPGIVSTDDLELEPAFAPNMKEFYFLRQSKGQESKNFVIKYDDGEWSEPVERSTSEGEVFISVDNKTMHLGNKYKERSASGWSEEKSLGELFEKFSIMRLTASSSSTYVFDERDSIGTIRYSRIINGRREDPKPFGKQINTGQFISHPFIAPDESYLIWDSEREDGYGGSDLYISFRQEDGSWGPSINMGNKINTDIDDFYGSVTSDGRYFYFSRVKLGESFEESHANIFWVDAQIIMNLKKTIK